MADMQISGRSAGRPLKRGAPNRTSTRVDLTPMVDLGFLLITFFMLTTELAKPQVMPVAWPDKTPVEDPPEFADSQVLTLLLGDGDQVYWYEGITDPRLDSTTFDSDGLRQVILKKKQAVREHFGDRMKPVPGFPGQTKAVSKLAVLIKATPQARYKNVVDVFDEMKICGVDHYVMIDISPQELEFIRNPAGGLVFTEAQQVAAAYRKKQ